MGLCFLLCTEHCKEIPHRNGLMTLVLHFRCLILTIIDAFPVAGITIGNISDTPWKENASLWNEERKNTHTHTLAFSQIRLHTQMLIFSIFFPSIVISWRIHSKQPWAQTEAEKAECVACCCQRSAVMPKTVQMSITHRSLLLNIKLYFHICQRWKLIKALDIYTWERNSGKCVNRKRDWLSCSAVKPTLYHYSINL